MWEAGSIKESMERIGARRCLGRGRVWGLGSAFMVEEEVPGPAATETVSNVGTSCFTLCVEPSPAREGGHHVSVCRVACDQSCD